ncbi:MAG: type III-B CRISPR module RAMP protein Cmr1 [Methanotrichaceae archaeon]
MLRSVVKCPGKPKNVEYYPNMLIKVYEIQVITPILGGGADAGKNDPVTLVRPSSIRGQLRQWWRATRGSDYKTLTELHQREGEIWGTTEKPSQVALEVKIKSQGKTYPCAYFPDDKNFPRFEKNHPPYALFPFQGNKRDGIPPANCTANVSFELKLTYPQGLSQDINSAVWAWVNFGGIGARTRRGAGALYCKELAPPDRSSITADLPAQAQKEPPSSWYKSCLKQFGVKLSSSQDWPTLPSSFLVRKSNSINVLQDWTEVVGLMQAFRQGQGVGRNLGSSQNRPGRSRWPEPESIRQATNSRSTRHSRMPAIPNDAFPRAELGLPIVFHFKDLNFGDPRDTELYPVFHGEEKTRMSSPLILRPMMCRNGDVLQLILKLNAPSPDEVVLEKANGNPHFKKIRDPTLASYPNSPLSSSKPGLPARSSSGCAIEGFLAYVKENGFVEVK